MSSVPAPADTERFDFWRRARRSPNIVIGGIIVVAVVLIAIFGPLFTTYDPTEVDMLSVWAEPGGDHLLGGDAVGRDILARLILGARVSLLIAASVLAITLTVGVTLGMLAGYLGGWVDTVIMRTVDLVFAFPDIIFAILIAAMLGAGTLTVIIALSLVWWPGVARLARSLVLTLRSEMYVEAAVASGTPVHRILIDHFLPNIVAPLIVRASIGVGFIIMAEATLSFLGIGVQEPAPTWGSMIRDGLPALRTDPYLALSASAALGITLVGFNLFGDGLRDILDPRVRER
jgi:ABC-type dipeptide/oligopeptide/nickel transport system permease subunit